MHLAWHVFLVANGINFRGLWQRVFKSLPKAEGVGERPAIFSMDFPI